ncbi:MAG: hypothetical protein HY060_07530 [Proteobacteria bacterium]|nr:hypothetical protein [Pseudomonadota bacterium]
MAFLQRTFNIACFFETGTLLGQTTAWAAERFAHVITVERAPEFFAVAKARFDGDPRVQTLFGDSREHMKLRAGGLPTTLFWLDAHWSGDVTAGEDDECPLLGEIAVIAGELDRHFVLIDDARLFLAPPPPPHKANHWPSLCETLDALRTRHQPYVVVHDDVLVAVPERARDLLVAFLRGEIGAPAPATP